MKQPPTDPYAFQALVIDAMCEDMFAMGSGKQTGFARTEALRAVSIARSDIDNELPDARGEMR